MSFYTSLTGLNSATAQLGVTSNNIANVGTTGFKRSRADFGDIFSTSPLQKSSSNIGQGVSLKQVSQEFSQGNVTTSGNSLDLAITGDGFFPLRSPDGLQEVYTRNGSFLLNDQNNVVNSAGQRLLAAAVDSSGKADLSKLAVLNIPPKTSGMARETTKIQLGLNLPADANVIKAEFDRTNPATYNKSTALTVYDSGGNGYLATAYYVKTQGASPTMPESKWQTYVYVGNSKVTPALMQASNKDGQKMYVNKYGDIKPESAIQDELVTGKTAMFSLNDLTDKRSSLPAKLTGQEIALQTTPPADIGKVLLSTEATFRLSIDDSSDVTVTIPASTTAQTPEEMAAKMTHAINKAFSVNSLFVPGQPPVPAPAPPTVAVTTPGTATDEGVVEITFKPLVAGQTINYGNETLTANEPMTAAEVAQAAASGTSAKATLKTEIGTANSNWTAISTDDKATFTRKETGPLQPIEISVSGRSGTPAIDNRRYGTEVTYDTASKKFIIVSGSTGDASSVKITAGAEGPADMEDSAVTTLGLVGEPTETSKIAALRGKASDPAILRGDAITVNTSGTINVTEENKKFNITVNGVKGTVTLLENKSGTIKDLEANLQAAINQLEDPVTGEPIRGVKVAFDEINNRLVFTTGNTGNEASIKVTGSADWGLSNTVIAKGTTSTWIEMEKKQFSEVMDGVKKPQFIDEDGKQTSLRDGYTVLPAWSPIYLDRGELSFDLSGKTLSPRSNMIFETAFLEGGKGALTMQIDFTQSTQYSSPFSVLSQSQDGAPEGDLMGLDIGVDGLVSANYSNGAQQSLGKIVLANFSSPTGLRQVGDASYLSSATSGAAKIGEGGSAGFGTIRAGATERANVDLTKELVDLITAQRNFQANAKAIETSSTMTSAIINIRS